MGTHAIQQDSHQARQHTLLIATHDPGQRAFLARQLDADGHTVYEADSTTGALTALCGQAIDVLLLGELQRPSDAPALLRAVRGGENPRIHPGVAVITILPGDELTTLRAYECGSDHHLPDDTGYVLLRAVRARSYGARSRTSRRATCRWERSASTWPPAASASVGPLCI
jgi:CheY-like chemotaxis protein